MSLSFTQFNHYICTYKSIIMTTMGAKEKIYGIIALAVLSLAFTVWCVVDEVYYLAVFGLLLFGLQVYNYLSIKKKK